MYDDKQGVGLVVYVGGEEDGQDEGKVAGWVHQEKHSGLGGRETKMEWGSLGLSFVEKQNKQRNTIYLNMSGLNYFMKSEMYGYQMLTLDQVQGPTKAYQSL